MNFLTTLLFWQSKIIDHAGLAAQISLSSGTEISPQAVLKKLKKAEVFFEALAHKTINANKFLLRNGTIKLEGIREIYLADSSVIGLRPSLATVFPGPGSKGSEAAVKLHLMHNLTRQEISRIIVTDGTTSDHSEKTAHLEIMHPGDLIIRDLGYFEMKDLRSIEKKKCFYLTRVPSTMKHYAESDGKIFDIWTKLADFKKNYFEQELTIGSENNLVTRIVAIKLPRAKRKEREKNLAKEKKRPLTITEITRSHWNLFATNMSSDQAPAEMVQKLYACRWQIELIFKAWKSNLHIDQISRAASAPIVLALIWAKILLAIILMLARSRVEAEIGKEIGVLSWYHRVSTQLERTGDLVRTGSFEKIAEFFLYIGLKYCCQGKRKRKSSLARVAIN